MSDCNLRQAWSLISKFLYFIVADDFDIVSTFSLGKQADSSIIPEWYSFTLSSFLTK